MTFVEICIAGVEEIVVLMTESFILPKPVLIIMEREVPRRFLQ
jgi:hypothetical protein